MAERTAIIDGLKYKIGRHGLVFRETPHGWRRAGREAHEVRPYLDGPVRPAILPAGEEGDAIIEQVMEELLS